MKIISLPPRGWANSYLIVNERGEAIVIDPAQPFVVNDLVSRGLKGTHVLLTHCHFDHVGGVAALQKIGARVYCSEAEKPLICTENDLFSRFGVPREDFSIDETFFDGEEKKLNGFSVRATVTPGHTVGSCCYLISDGEETALFTGDTLFADSIGRTDFPTGDLKQMRASLLRLKNLEGEYPLYAGHNEQTTLERERKYNPFLQDL